MIGVIFMFGSEMIEVRVEDNSIMFRTGVSNGLVPIEGLQLSQAGVINEFPDLKDNVDWRHHAIKRFKEKVTSFETEKEKMDYIIEDLGKHGYIPKYIQKGGHRVKRI